MDEADSSALAVILAEKKPRAVCLAVLVASSTTLNFSAWLGYVECERSSVSQQYKLYLHCKKHKVGGEKNRSDQEANVG